jgi:hypothetical protein
MKKQIKICCVLKSGGVYRPPYVWKLFNGVRKNYSGDFKFLCLSDYGPEVQLRDPRFYHIPLKHGFEGWWSKMELFLQEGPLLYFDLDTIVVGDITPLVKAVEGLCENEIIMLRPFNPRQRHGSNASGVMGWVGDKSEIFFGFNYRDRTHYFGDQNFINCSIRDRGIVVSHVQDYIGGVHSFKRECQQELPKGARIVCFHGRPRPHEVYEENKNCWLEGVWQ